MLTTGLIAIYQKGLKVFGLRLSDWTASGREFLGLGKSKSSWGEWTVIIENPGLSFMVNCS